MLQRPAQSKLRIPLAVIVLSVTLSACFTVTQADGNINPCYLCDGSPVGARFTVFNQESWYLVWNIWQNDCAEDNPALGGYGWCTFQKAYGLTNDAIFHEALADWSSFNNAANGYFYTCPDGGDCNGYFYPGVESRCFYIDVSGPTITDILNWNLVNASYVGNSWGWYRAGNGGCTGTN